MRPNYLDLMEQIHDHLRPSTYVEIGIGNGRSLARVLPHTHAIGIDPKRMRGAKTLSCWFKRFELESDDFFEQHDLAEVFEGRPVELAFIDGMHLFEYALRDFMNVERFCGPDSVVLVHDCIPIDAEVSNRDRTMPAWTGDVWKLPLCLREYRPDLTVSIVDSIPSGLGVVTDLDPSSTVLREKYDEILDRFVDLDYEWIDARREELDVIAYDWERVQTLLAAPRANA